MKPALRLRIFAFFSLVFVTGLLAASREAQWQKVDEARQNGLPKTAVEALEPIIQGAIADHAYAEAIKAIGRKIAFEGNIQGNKPEEKIAMMQAALPQVPKEMKAVMETILAHWYWRYFQQNRWKFMQRTQTAVESGPDVTTWDLARILTEIDRHFSAALADSKKLQGIPINDYDELLQPGDVPDNYRPTLYDFLAYEALRFYEAGEHGVTRREDGFELDASSPIFADAAEFTGWKVTTTDDTAPAPKALRLYQSLLDFHRSDIDRSAFYDADLARLVYGYNIAVGENKPARYQTALERFVETTTTHEVSARALATLAQLAQREGDLAKAHQLAQRGLQAFPQSAGGAMCFNLLQEIEVKSVQLDTESIWSTPQPTLNVNYRNLDKIYFRAVPVNFDDQVRRMRWGQSFFDLDRRKELLASSPLLEWSADLPATDDFKVHTANLPAPPSLKPGFYLILASYDHGFAVSDNQLSVAAVWVSDLTLVVETRNDERALQHAFVLNAESGNPVAGATVTIWAQDAEGWFRPQSPVKTDENGRCDFRIGKNQSFLLLAEHGAQRVSGKSERPDYFNGHDAEQPVKQTIFLTDRALYRPGQTIHYKGICISSDPEKPSYATIAGKKVVVSFRDPNGKEMATATHLTNDYGSFSGVFTAPRDTVTGNMALVIANGPAGSANFEVEEYKRPKFQVEIKPPTEAAKLGMEVNLTGNATAYTGAAIGGAKVQWRVERNTQLPFWCWWWQPPASAAIAHGTALTEADGTFKIHFIAEPDRTIPAKNDPVFAYLINADVTDSTGETRSESHTVHAGYTGLTASLAADEWQTAQNPVKLTVETKSLDGDPQSANGSVAIHSLKQPTKVQRAPLIEENLWVKRNLGEPRADPAVPDSWELGEAIVTQPFKTDSTTGETTLLAALKPGIYRALLETKDRSGQKVTSRLTFQVVGPYEKRYPIKIASSLSAPKWSIEPGENFTALWGTGYDTGRAFVELEFEGKPLKSYWTAVDRTQELIEFPVNEKMRGGLTLHVTYVRENRAHFHEHIINVPWSNKELNLRWEHFRSRLTPGQKETWTAVIGGPDARNTVAEMAAVLYDASLDQISPHEWPSQFNVFRNEDNASQRSFGNEKISFQSLQSEWPIASRQVAWRYRSFQNAQSGGLAFGHSMGDPIIGLDAFVVTAETSSEGYRAVATLAGTRINTNLRDVGSSISVVTKQMLRDVSAAAPQSELQYTNSTTVGVKPDLNQITARKNLTETAFFFPQLLADKNGAVRMVFTMPEALTQWKFMGFAHDKELRSGFLTDKVVTAKDLMVEPNPPRFVREGDAIEFTVKVSNQTDQPQTGAVKLTFADAASLQPVDDALGNRATEQKFDVPAKQSRSFSWRIVVPDGMGFLTYKAVGATKQASDGEEGFLPVLSRRILVTESLPLPIRGKTTRKFDFKKLIESGQSDTLRHESLTVQMVSQPAWYAVMALPYLMEYPYECSEQVFNRLYGNALARHIAGSDPKIRRIFDQWKNTPALDSPLAKNEDLKSLTLEETPWLRQANHESQARRNVGLLFDANRLDDESARALAKLADRQLSDGLWSWFPGGRSSEYISLYITTGFGRLRHLGAEVDVALALKSLAALDAWMAQQYREILKSKSPEKYVPGYTDAFYLYGRSFFLKDRPIAKEHQDAVDFFLRQSRKFWLQLDSRQNQAHLALALERFGDQQTALDIVKSLKERSVSNEDLGMYWRDQESGWWWYHAPIETQAMMIEAFAEVAHDARAVEDCKVWLLKQKQTQDWKTTKATADAIYGLLLQGDNLLSSDALVEVSLGGESIKPEHIEAGTGFYEEKFVHREIKPAMGKIVVKKVDDGVSWGSVHWQYLEDMSKVAPHEGTPLKLKKALFIKETTAKGQVLKPVTGPISVGDELVVRLELRTDRDMEYVHLKDQRGSGTEPVNVLSQYKYQDGLAYYESTRDTASHFFIDYLRKGAYVFEYSTRVQLKGNYQTGIAEIQCMYAPEFNSHSESFTLEVK